WYEAHGSTVLGCGGDVRGVDGAHLDRVALRREAGRSSARWARIAAHSGRAGDDRRAAAQPRRWFTDLVFVFSRGTAVRLAEPSLAAAQTAAWDGDRRAHRRRSRARRGYRADSVPDHLWWNRDRSTARRVPQDRPDHGNAAVRDRGGGCAGAR